MPPGPPGVTSMDQCLDRSQTSSHALVHPSPHPTSSSRLRILLTLICSQDSKLNSSALLNWVFGLIFYNLRLVETQKYSTGVRHPCGNYKLAEGRLQSIPWWQWSVRGTLSISFQALALSSVKPPECILQNRTAKCANWSPSCSFLHGSSRVVRLWDCIIPCSTPLKSLCAIKLWSMQFEPLLCISAAHLALKYEKSANFLLAQI